MENNCNIIKDLIPLYAEGLASEDSAKLVETHVAGCADCAAELEKVKTDAAAAPEIADSAVPLKVVNKALRQRRARIAALCALGVFLVLTVLFSASVRRNYIPYSVSGSDTDPEAGNVISVEQLPDGALHIEVSEEATRYDIEYMSSDDDPAGAKTDAVVYAWSTKFGTLTGDQVEDIYISADKGVTTVDFCDCANGGELIRVYGEDRDGGGIVLKRLVLGYYAILSAISLAVFGLLWLILRKKRAGKVMRYLFFMPASYLLAHFLIMGKDAMTYAAAESFGFIAAAFAAIYAIIVISLRMRDDAREAQ